MKKKNETKKRRVSLSTILLVAALLVGMGIMLYPTVSDYWNSLHQTRAIASYDQAVEAMDQTDYQALLAAAETYNRHLSELSDPFSQAELLEEEYQSVLDITGNGIMGYVTIDKIGVDLPIYHGTDEAVLNIAAGHLEGSSLPIGGEGNHSVISAHRGLPSAKLFTKLDELEAGDTFTVTILDQVLTYEVDQILIVEPTQLEALYPVAGEDYCTLQTCTPYGVNSHRLLVRGHRIETVQGTLVLHEDASQVPTYIVAPAVAIPILFILLVILLIVYRKKPASVTTEDIRQLCRTMDETNQNKKEAPGQPEHDGKE